MSDSSVYWRPSLGGALPNKWTAYKQSTNVRLEYDARISIPILYIVASLMIATMKSIPQLSLCHFYKRLLIRSVYQSRKMLYNSHHFYVTNIIEMILNCEWFVLHKKCRESSDSIYFTYTTQTDNSSIQSNAFRYISSHERYGEAHPITYDQVVVILFSVQYSTDIEWKKMFLSYSISLILSQ